MVEKFSRYDPADGLDSVDAIEIFLADAFETGDAAHIGAALGVVARAKGMAEMAAAAGLTQEQLHRALNADETPTLKAVLAVMKSVGLVLATERRPAAAANSEVLNRAGLALDKTAG